MLGKLYRYEMKATAHYFLPLFAAVLVMSVLVGIMERVASGGPGWLSGLLITIEVLLMIALGMMTLIVMVLRFHKNLLGQEGYLMFTLPVSTHDNIFSKLLGAMTWGIASALIISVSIVIMVARFPDLQAFWQELVYIIQNADVPMILICFELLLWMLLSLASAVLMFYLAMAIGQLFNEHKFLASFAAYIGISIILTIITTILGVIGGNIIDYNSISEWLRAMSYTAASQWVMLGLIASALIPGVIYYIFTHWLLNKRLNLT